MTERQPKTVSELESNLASLREELTSTIDQLTAKISPAGQFEDIKGQMGQKAEETSEAVKAALAKGKETVQEQVNKAAEGDRQAQAIVYGSIAAAGLLAVGALAALLRR